MENQELIKLGKNIRAQRTKLSFSQELLAQECDFDRTYISLLERGKRNPSYLNLLKLSDGLGISVCELINCKKGKR